MREAEIDVLQEVDTLTWMLFIYLNKYTKITVLSYQDNVYCAIKW